MELAVVIELTLTFIMTPLLLFQESSNTNLTFRKLCVLLDILAAVFMILQSKM